MNEGHEQSFNEVPRLSTVQAQLVLMKARETQPGRRGYFYRSWTALVNIVSMSKDLGLHEHLGDHEYGQCGLNAGECITRTRTWQTVFILEAMIGGPQGAYNNFSRD